MRSALNRLINSNSVTIYLFIHGILIQAIAFAIIYGFSLAFRERESVVETLISLWFCIPVLAVFSILIASIQIKIRKRKSESYRVPLIGLSLNILWLFGYLLALDVIFVVIKPF